MERIGNLPGVSESLAGGMTPEGLLAQLFDGIPYDTLEKRALAFSCSCSREKVERALISLGTEELRQLLEEQGEAAVTCEFCRESYPFGRDDLEALRDDLSAKSII
jgi:molecular chaperone Hsp33